MALVSGVAPQASLASWVIFGTSFFGQDNVVDNETLMDILRTAFPFRTTVGAMRLLRSVNLIHSRT